MKFMQETASYTKQDQKKWGHLR